MSSKICVIIIIALVTGSCVKENSQYKPVIVKVPAALIGTWNWFASHGGYAGVTITPATTGEVRRIEYDSNNNFRYYVNDVLRSESKYHVERGISVFDKDTTLLIVTGTWPSPVSFGFTTADTLTLNEQAFDGFDYHYVRIK